MEEKKHIDRLYQEKFKDFEATPREAVWRNISDRLKEKNRKRKVLPLWYKLAGVAAVLALFINFANGLFRNTSGNSRVATEMDENFGVFDLASTDYSERMIKSSIILQALIQNTQNRRALEINSFENNVELSETVPNEITAPVDPSSAVVSRRAIDGIINLNEDRNYKFNDLESTNTKITSINRTEGNNYKGKLRNLPLPGKEKATEDEILTSKEISKRIRVTTTAAPIYYDNLGKGSSIDTRFSNNENDGEITMSYGINFAYQISEKVKIRSGISKLDISHNTRNIAFTAAVHPIALRGIDYGGNVPNFRIENRSLKPFSNTYASTQFDRASLATPTAGYLNQRMGFIEVPLEIEYSLVDRKIGLNIIGGGSTLFLDENIISLNSANFSTPLGGANNLNSVSFTTNIGVGVDYKFSPRFQVNLEPIFKYQINTFNSTTTRNLNPYFFGVYSGFSFKF